MSTKPKIILICKGGIIQEAIANADVEIINLDYDIFEDSITADNDEDYDNRTMGNTLAILKGRKFDKMEKVAKEEWNKKLSESISDWA